MQSNKGQTFFEFIFLLVIMFALSFSFMRGTNYAVGRRWKLIVKMVTTHDLSTPHEVKLR